MNMNIGQKAMKRALYPKTLNRVHSPSICVPEIGKTGTWIRIYVPENGKTGT